jgi:hypothetical protein
MNLQKRIDLLIRLQQYILSDSTGWEEAKLSAEASNKWFTQQFISTAATNIADQYLNPEKLLAFVSNYAVPPANSHPLKVGLVMAGNIPLVGFHDWLCVFLTGHHVIIKSSSKDQVLFTHLMEKLYEWEPLTRDAITFADLLKGCDAYIATGSNNSARYFDYYFKKYPNIIRSNKTSVAILTGQESPVELGKLSDDINLYFGLGCRNVTKIYVPEGYDFRPLLAAFDKYAYFIDHAKYKNNYDYQLAIHLINHKYYMTNGSVLLSENAGIFSPISQLNYEFYKGPQTPEERISGNSEIQCIVGEGFTPFGQSQCPSLSDFADGVDTLDFLMKLA